MEVLIFLLCLLLVWFLWPIVWRLVFWALILAAFGVSWIYYMDQADVARQQLRNAESRHVSREAPEPEKCQHVESHDEFLTCEGDEP